MKGVVTRQRDKHGAQRKLLDGGSLHEAVKEM